jgi:hypothetical protein
VPALTRDLKALIGKQQLLFHSIASCAAKTSTPRRIDGGWNAASKMQQQQF